MKQLKFRSVGECMAELQPAGDGHYSLAFGGDTLNTCWYVRALITPDNFDVEYVTGLGSDPLSAQLSQFLDGNGIGTRFIRNVPDRNVGLYLITLHGAERSFTYWRSSSAARLLAEDPQHLTAAFTGANLIYFSGITLAILPDENRHVFLDQLKKLKAEGATIAFDSNMRPRLWPSPQHMKEAVIAGCRAATIALPTFPDEQTLFGDQSPADCAKRIASYGVAEVVVKNGALPSLGLAGGAVFEVAPETVPTLVDTTGAGDSFNAGYLVGRMRGMSPEAASRLGHQVAGRVICHKGALVAMDRFSDLRMA